MSAKSEEAVRKEALARQLHDSGSSALGRYRKKALGDVGFGTFLIHEVGTALFGNLSGGAGYAARKIVYRRLFRRSGAGTILGKGLTVRHPKRVSLGDRVAIDDYCFIDACGAGDAGVVIGDDVVISRNCVVQGKNGPVSIGNHADFGCNTIITSHAGVHVGEHALIAANCYIGGGRYGTERTDVPIMYQAVVSRGPIEIGDGSWLGAGVMILDGVRVGKGCVLGAGAVVTDDIPDLSIAVGVPARVVGTRGS